VGKREGRSELDVPLKPTHVNKMMKREQNILPDLVGTRFVRTYTAFLMDAVRDNPRKAEDLMLKGFMEKGVKTKTTQRYIKELIELDLFQVSDDGLLSMKNEGAP
jgi:hypothetical protein